MQRNSRRESIAATGLETPSKLSGSFVFTDGTRYEGSYLSSLAPLSEDSIQSPVPETKKQQSAPVLDLVDPGKNRKEHLVRQGFGKNTQNGFVYEGEFHEDMMHGQGKLSCPNGVCYEVS
jgi:hypothetical protein